MRKLMSADRKIIREMLDDCYSAYELSTDRTVSKEMAEEFKLDFERNLYKLKGYCMCIDLFVDIVNDEIIVGNTYNPIDRQKL